MSSNDTAALCRRVRELDRLYLDADAAWAEWANHEGPPEDEQRLKEQYEAKWWAYKALRDGGGDAEQPS